MHLPNWESVMVRSQNFKGKTEKYNTGCSICITLTLHFKKQLRGRIRN